MWGWCAWLLQILMWEMTLCTYLQVKKEENRIIWFKHDVNLEKKISTPGTFCFYVSFLYVDVIEVGRMLRIFYISCSRPWGSKMISQLVFLLVRLANQRLVKFSLSMVWLIVFILCFWTAVNFPHKKFSTADLSTSKVLHIMFFK